MEQNQFEFKPFDKVLMRYDDKSLWRPNIFSRNIEDAEYPYEGINGNAYKQCIPYNEETAYLINTNKPYQKSEPKKWRIFEYVHQYQRRVCDEDLTDEELKHFIEKVVIDNADITNFQVTLIL